MSDYKKEPPAAFPVIDEAFYEPGLTKREWFAGMAQMGFCANPSLDAWKNSIIADLATAQADATMRHLNDSELAAAPPEKS